MTFNYSEMLDKKSVCFVGPAASTEGKGCGDLIDSYDIVARFGRGVNHGCPEDLGTKTDVIVENLWEWRPEVGLDHEAMIEEYINSGARLLRMIYPHHWGVDSFLKKNHGRIQVSYMPESEYLDINNLIGSPTKGIVGMMDFLRFNISELFVIGFTFLQNIGYRQPGSPIYPKDNIAPTYEITDDIHGGHRNGREIKFFKKLKANDPRLVADEALENILNTMSLAGLRI